MDDSVRTRDHVPPLLRGLGFVLLLLASLAGGVMEHRGVAEANAAAAQAKARMGAVASSVAGHRADSIAGEIRLLRLQLQEDDFADKVFENPWFQALGALGTALIAASFLFEARAKWPHQPGSRGALPP